MRLLKNFSVFFITILFVFLFFELGIRIFHVYKYGIKVKDSFVYGIQLKNNYSFDNELGWKNNNSPYGFQIYGDINSDKKKILIIGDSFTRCLQIPNNKTYYSYLNKNKFELFVYGADGYSTLQKYQILNKFINKITPDYIVLQLCWNDFIENSYNLSSKSYLNIINIKRPYLINKQFKLCDPSKNNILIYLANHYSKFIRFLLSRLQLFSYNIEKEINRKGEKNNLFQDAINISDNIFNLIKKKSKTTPIIVFNVDNEQPYLKKFENLSLKYDFIYLKEIPLKIQDSLNKGEKIMLLDNAHWNKLGHKIAGEILNNYLEILPN